MKISIITHGAHGGLGGIDKYSAYVIDVLAKNKLVKSIDIFSKKIIKFNNKKTNKFFSGNNIGLLLLIFTNIINILKSNVIIINHINHVPLLLIPILLIPVLMFGVPLLFSSTEERIGEQIQYVAIINYEASESFVQLIDNSRSLNVINIDMPADESIRNGIVSVVLEIPKDYDQRIKNEQLVNITIYYDASSRTSNIAYSKIIQVLSMYRGDVVNNRLESREIDPQILHPLRIFAENVATEDEVSGYMLSLILPPLLAIIVATGGMNAAIDLTVGEKERHTLEALLVTATSRRDLITGKFLAVVTTTLLSIAFIMLSLSGSVSYLSRLPMQQMGISLTLQTSIIVFVILTLMAIYEHLRKPPKIIKHQQNLTSV
mgnify:CR=1 FL=1